MESADNFMSAIASSSLWLAGSGLVLWLCLRSRLQVSPGTRAVASLLIVLQGWIWFGIPIQLGIPAQFGSAWIAPRSAIISSQQAAATLPRKNISEIEAADRLTPLPFASPLPFGEELPSPVSAMPSVARMAAIGAGVIWLAGIAILLWRSIDALRSLCRMVQALPPAPAEWQNELSALCVQRKISTPPLLKISQLATPMLVQTFESARVVVPAWLWESCTAGQRQSILLHELAHLQRGDIWRQLAMRLLVLPHWFNPVAWWAARQFEAASEAACDDAACGGDPRQAISYCKALLVLNERLGIRYAPALAVSGGSLTERIHRVLHPQFHKESQMSRFLILALMIAFTSLATVRIQAAGPSSLSGNESAENDLAKDEPANAPGATLRRRTITEEFDHAEPAKALAGSLLANGGFEEAQDDSNDPQSWFGTRLPKTAGHFLMGASKSVAHSGKRSVVVAIGDSHPDLRVDYNWTAVAKGWKAGETYELSGWIKTENARQPAFIMAQFWSEEGKNGKMLGGAGTEKAFPVKGTTDWTRVSTRLKVPAGTGVLRIRAGLSSQGNPGAKAWLDDISLVKLASN